MFIYETFNKPQRALAIGLKCKHQKEAFRRMAPDQRK